MLRAHRAEHDVALPDCERRGELAGASWRVVLGWFFKPMLALVVAIVVLYLLFGDRQ